MPKPTTIFIEIIRNLDDAPKIPFLYFQQKLSSIEYFIRRKRIMHCSFYYLSAESYFPSKSMSAFSVLRECNKQNVLKVSIMRCSYCVLSLPADSSPLPQSK
jgi:hypothetical protein